MTINMKKRMAMTKMNMIMMMLTMITTIAYQCSISVLDYSRSLIFLLVFLLLELQCVTMLLCQLGGESRTSSQSSTFLFQIINKCKWPEQNMVKIRLPYDIQGIFEHLIDLISCHTKSFLEFVLM